MEYPEAPLEHPETERIALYYRLEIVEEGGPVVYNRVFDTGRIRDLSFFTLPLNVLELNKNYRWRIRLTDNGIWENVQNRSNSEWLYFTTPGSWAPHVSLPVLDPDTWGLVTYSTENGPSYVISVLVVDMDGVSSGGFSATNPMSHSVQMALPGGGTYDLYFYRADSPTSAYYEGYTDGTSLLPARIISK